MQLLTGFAALALVLASLGIYGVVSYGVSQRVPEIGVRMALGATRRDVRRQIVADALRLTATGIVLGAALALALSRTIDTLLYATSPTDPLAFAAMILLLTAIALAAAYVPALRASRIDPVVALRG